MGWCAHPPFLERSKLPTQRPLIKRAIWQTMNFTTALPYSIVIAMQHNDVAASKRMQRTGPRVVVRQEADNNNAAFRGRERELHRFCGAPKVRKIVFLYVKTVSPPGMWWCVLWTFTRLLKTLHPDGVTGSNTYVYIAVKMENLMDC